MKPALLTLQTCLWNATFRRPVSLFLFVLLFILIWAVLFRIKEHIEPSPSDEVVDWEAEYEKVRIAGLREHMSFYVPNPKDMKPVPLDWTARDLCPACFGTDMCASIERQEILVEIPQIATSANKKGVYLGQWKDVPVAVKRLSNWYPKEFELFDKFICRNATGSETCNVSVTITSKQSFVQQDDTFSPDKLHHAWQISYPQVGAQAITYMLCMTPHIVKKFSGLYDYNNDGVLTADEKAMLFTSMVVQPESLMLKFLKGIQFQRLAPRVYGACGRLVVVEHGGQLLSSYLNATFSDRAELGLQLLSLVQVLWHADRRWFALYKDFEFENIAVSHEKEVFLVDYEDLSIIENTDFDEANDEDRHEEHRFGHNVTCNADCFERVLSRLSSETVSKAERAEHCESLHSISGSLMYSTLCRNILSDIQEHRAIANKGGTAYRGLLHSIPNFEEVKDVPEKITNALRECVSETTAGGRIQAVNEIADLLSIFIKMH
jgi:hypothetical protein